MHALLLILACRPDQGLTPFDLQSVAVVAGDFDRVETVLAALQVPTTLYEGYIVGPATGVDRVDAQALTPTVEGLLSATDAQGQPELDRHDAVFFNSGVRGLGALVYNGLEPDDAILADPQQVGAIVEWVEGGGVLVVSDWAIDLVEAGWPELLTLAREEQGPDAAQIGLSGPVPARVVDPALAASLGVAELELAFDFAWWTVIEGVGDDAEVLLVGDVLAHGQLAADEQHLDAPLVVRADVGRGRIVLSSFHWIAQPQGLARSLLPWVVEGLP